MNKDVDNIRKLYEKNNLLNLNDVDVYIQYSYGLYPLIIESVNPKNKTEIYGISDSYEVTTTSNKSFDVLISYYNNINAADVVNKKEIYANHKNDIITGTLYKNIKKTFNNTDQYLCMIMFADSLDRTNITGEVGIESYELFLGVQEAVKDSFIIQNRLHDIQVLGIRVSKKEPKQLAIYKKIMNKHLGSVFAYSYIYNTTEADKDNDVLIFTRTKI